MTQPATRQAAGGAGTTAEQAPLAIGVIGCGHWGPNHVRAFLSLPGARVLRAADPARDRLDHIARTHPGVAVTPNPADVLADPAIDAVVVATPAATHAPIVRAALLAGKHVLCEKPLCLSSREARELDCLAKDRGLVLMVGHVFLFNGGIQKLQQLLQDGELGRLHYATAMRTNLGPIRSDVNAAWDLAAHEVSIFNHLLDAAPERVAAVGRACVSTDIEDVVFATLWYPRGMVVSVTASWLSPKKVREITIVGDARMATWNDLAAGPVAVYDKGAAMEPSYENFGEFQLAVREGDVTIPRVSPEEPLRRQARFFLESVQRGSATFCDGERAARVTEALEAMAQSLCLGGTPVDLA